MYRAWWFDSLGMSPLEHTLEVKPGELSELDLATPALATYQFLQCGEVLDTLDTILHGEVTDGDGMPIEGAEVFARWRSLIIDGDSALHRRDERKSVTRPSGGYMLCGVPKDAIFDLVARSAAADSANELRIRISPLGDIRRRDLVLGDPAARARVRGGVATADGTPIRQATVVSLLHSEQIVATRPDGTFELGIIGRRSQQLRVRAIGYEPRVIDIDPRAPLLELPVIVLQPRVAGLDTVRITGRTDPSDWRSAFDQRRAVGTGSFITEEQLQRMPRITGNQIAQMATRIRMNRGLVMLAQGVGGCLPRWYIDGYDNGTEVSNGPGWASTTLNLARSIEVYSAAEAPPKYNDFDGCGVIVVWTR